MKHEVKIEGYLFDIGDGKMVRLVSPAGKFWEGTVNSGTLKVKVGKDKNGTQTNIEEMTKKYPTHELSRASIIEKIKEKLQKGYISQGGLKEAKVDSEPSLKRDIQKDEDIKTVQNKPSRSFSGQYYERAGQGIKLEVSNNKVKVTRIGTDKREKTEIQTFSSHDQAVNYCIKEEDWLLGQKYQVQHHKFIYSFVDDDEKPAPRKNNHIQSQHASNHLSITALTDDAISRSSRSLGISPTRSDRSADNADEDDFKPSSLGPPSSTCINVLLAETWEDGVDPAGWFMSEKLDGVRCFWTGTQMFSRNKNRFNPPRWFTKNWPKSQMDGELFIGRNKFSETISAIKKNTPIDSEWEKVVYLVFDAPGLKKPFKERIKLMEDVITKVNNPHLKCHAHRQCNSFTDMFNQLEAVNKIKGQGLMLRDPESYYENRRSKTLLKVKTFYDDEATVLGYKEGTGRCQGMVGALKVRNTHGVEFEVGSGMNDDMRRKPPKIGTVITYKYQEFNEKSGKPRFPTFLRIYQPL